MRVSTPFFSCETEVSSDHGIEYIMTKHGAVRKSDAALKRALARLRKEPTMSWKKAKRQMGLK